MACSGKIRGVTSSPNLDEISPTNCMPSRRSCCLRLILSGSKMGKKNHHEQTIIEQLTHEIAWLKRSEQLSPAQGSLLDDLLDTDIAAIRTELKVSISAKTRFICMVRMRRGAKLFRKKIIEDN